MNFLLVVSGFRFRIRRRRLGTAVAEGLRGNEALNENKVMVTVPGLIAQGPGSLLFAQEDMTV